MIDPWELEQKLREWCPEMGFHVELVPCPRALSRWSLSVALDLCSDHDEELFLKDKVLAHMYQHLGKLTCMIRRMEDEMRAER